MWTTYDFMIAINLHMCPRQDTLWLYLPTDLDDQFLISNKILKDFPKFAIRVVPLQFQTCGALETLFAVLK